MHRPIVFAALAAGALAGSPAGAVQESDVYQKAVECGSLHGFYAGFLEETEPVAAAANEEMSTRYFILAINHRGGEIEADVLNAAAAEEAGKLAARAEDPAATEAEVEAFFGERNAFCDAFHAEVQDEFDAIDLSE